MSTRFEKRTDLIKATFLYQPAHIRKAPSLKYTPKYVSTVPLKIELRRIRVPEEPLMF